MKRFLIKVFQIKLNGPVSTLINEKLGKIHVLQVKALKVLDRDGR